MVHGLFTQISIIALSAVGIIWYINPTFQEVGEIQQQTAEYQASIDDVAAVNRQLDALVTRMNNISEADMDRIETYLPTEYDPIHTMRDLLTIAGLSNVASAEVEAEVTSRRQNTRSNAITETSETATPHNVHLTVTGEYEDIKQLFFLLEQNDYPLEVDGFQIKPNDTGTLEVSLDLITYTYTSNTI